MHVLSNICSDCVATIVLQLAVVGLFVVSLLGSLRVQMRVRKGAVRATAQRGEQTMGRLWAAYGVLTVICALAVQVAEGLEGFKVGLIVFDYGVLTYLFFFNSWFRNAIAIRLLALTTQD